MSRRAQAMLLLVVGAAVLRAGMTPLYLRYLRAGFRPELLAAGVVLIAVAVITCCYDLAGARTAGPGDTPDHGDGDAHGHREPRIAWLLVLPLFALIVVVPPALGSYAADRQGTALLPPPGFPTLPSGDPLDTTLDDYATRAVYDHGHSLTGRHVRLIGFVSYDGRGIPYLTRMILNCCAADAQPIKVALTGQLPADPQPDHWLDVVGTYSARQLKDAVNGRPIPFLQVDSAQPVPAPADEYES